MYREFLCGPFVKDFDGVKANGYIFSRCNDMSNPLFKMKKEEKWYLIEDGNFFLLIDDGDKMKVLQGTFDSSKFEDYVNQIKQFKTEWMGELTYNDDEDCDLTRWILS